MGFSRFAAFSPRASGSKPFQPLSRGIVWDSRLSLTASLALSSVLA